MFWLFFYSVETSDTQDLLSIFKQLPRKGNFKLESVLDSTYFFS